MSQNKINSKIEQENIKTIGDKRAAVKLIQDEFDKLAKEFDKNFELKRPLEFLMSEFEDFVEIDFREQGIGLNNTFII